jgi:hypothetical protein
MPILDYDVFKQLTIESLFVACCVLRYLVRAITTLTKNDIFAFLVTFISVSSGRFRFTKYDQQDDSKKLSSLSFLAITPP